MVASPAIDTRDGTSTVTSLVLTTNRSRIVLTGTVDASTVSIQVSLNGGPWTTDPTLVSLVDQRFTIPDLQADPSGLGLSPGENIIALRAIDIFGKVSVPSTARIFQDGSLPFSQDQIPSGIRAYRSRDSVEIRVAKPTQQFSATGVPLPFTFRGFNLYASTNPGGEGTGYARVNPTLITEESSETEEDTLPIDNSEVLWTDLSEKSVRVRVTEQDEFGNELRLILDKTVDVSAYRDRLRFKGEIEASSPLQFLTYTHRRDDGSSLNDDLWVDVPTEDPLYYVVTAVYFDPDTGIEIETPYSEEVLASPLVIDTTIRDLPGRSILQIQTDYINAVLRVNQEISLIPGSTTRDVSVDPFASEMERVWFLLDFVHRSQSFLTLLQIDDANGDGISDPVVSSAYKQALKAALGLTSDGAVQALIDQQFDKLAGNVGESRQIGRTAIGQVVFYTTVKPTVDKTIPSGTLVTAPADASLGVSTVRFRTGGTATIPASLADAFYNFDRKRYEITVDITAETPGSEGNVPASAIKTVTGASGFAVTNLEATAFGRDIESNADLAARAILRPTSVDSGTEDGIYLHTVRNIGVLKAKVVKSGDPLMMRDYDPIRRKHIGGKVDVWVQGLRERQITETFAFTFDIARDITCTLVDLPTLTFRVNDSRVTPDTPIVQMLDDLPNGLGVRNATLGQDYDLTGVVLLDYQTFKLNTLVPQPVTALDDVVLADYRFRSVNQFKLSFQPVRRVVSVVGEVSGPLSTDGYTLYKTEDPLLEGESTIASDYVEVNQVLGVPSGNTITLNDERHILIGSTEEPLQSVGINTQTIRVFSADRSVEYLGPTSPTPDFLIIPGSPTTPPKIVRSATSTIPSGSTVSVDYTHDENFAVTYVINDLLQTVQMYLDTVRHATADVLVKQAIDNPISVEMTVQMKSGASKDKVDPALRTAISLEFNKKTIGQDTAQSDVIRAADATEGVDYIVVPMAKMCYFDGCRRIREDLGNATLEIPSLNQLGNKVYVLTTSFFSPTIDKGGVNTEHKGVFENDEPFTAASSLATLGASNRSYFIVGKDGAVIPGYSDDATLILAGFNTPATIAAERVRRTANRAYISKSLEIKSSDRYTVSYIVYGDSGSKDIVAADVDFNSLGDLTVSYRTATGGSVLWRQISLKTTQIE